MELFGLDISRKAKQPVATQAKGLIQGQTVDFGPSTAVTVNFGDWFTRGYGGSKSNDPIDGNGVVAVALRWLIDSITNGEVITQRYEANRYATDPTNPVTKLLRRPGGYMTGEQLDQARAVSLVMDGNAYVYKARNGNGRVAQLQFLSPTSVTPKKDAEGLYYEVQNSKGGKTRVEWGDIIHSKRGTIDPSNELRVVSPLRRVLSSVMSDNEAEAYILYVLKNIGITGALITPSGDDQFSDDQAQAIKDRFEAATTGSERGKPLVTNLKVELSNTGYSPEQLNLDRIRVIPEARIIGAIGIPGMALGLTSGEDTKTFSNYGEALSASYRHFLKHVWRALDSASADSLLPEYGYDPDAYRVARDLSEVEELAEVVSDRMIAEYGAGLRKRSEARQELNLPVEDADDVYFLDAQAAGLNTEQAKSIVKADILRSKKVRELAEVG